MKFQRGINFRGTHPWSPEEKLNRGGKVGRFVDASSLKGIALFPWPKERQKKKEKKGKEKKEGRREKFSLLRLVKKGVPEKERERTR